MDLQLTTGQNAGTRGRLASCLLIARPRPLGDPVEEAAFLREFRAGGLITIAVACALVCAAYVGFGILVSLAREDWIQGFSPRLLPILVAGAAVVAIRLWPERVLTHYPLIAGAIAATLFIGACGFWAVDHPETPLSEVSAPVALIAIWILYGNFRLPLSVAGAIGVLGSVHAFFNGPLLTTLPAAEARTIVYLTVANLLGLAMAHALEQRERALFQQRRAAEAAQRALQARTTTAESGAAAKTRLVASLGHELRQPLMSASLHVSVLEQRLAAADLSGALAHARDADGALRWTHAVVSQLFDAVRLELEASAIERRPVSVSQLFEQLRGVVEPQFRAAQVSLSLRLPREDLTVLSQREALMMVLSNLVTNAIKYARRTPTNLPRVLVAARAAGGVCRLEVIDNGIGIPGADLDAIWAPFYRASEARSAQTGLGIGLYLSRMLLDRLEGHSIRIRSRVGAGSWFRVELPLAVSPGAPDRC